MFFIENAKESEAKIVSLNLYEHVEMQFDKCLFLEWYLV